MNKMTALIIVISLVLMSLPAFAVRASATQEKTLFQIAYDSMEAAYQAREKTGWKDPVDILHPMFEQVKDKLNALDEKSATAKNLSLRSNKEEVLRRRLIK